MARIGTVIVTMPRLLGDIIRALVTDHAALDVVAEFDSRTDAETRLPVIAPDLILVGLRAGETDAIGRAFLALVPSSKVIAFSSDGRNGYLHEMRAQRVEIADISSETLIDAILGAPPDPKV